MLKLRRSLERVSLFLAIAVSITGWIVLPVPVLLGCAVALVAWLAVTRTGHQAAAVTWVGILTLPQRIGASSVIVVGIAGVVGVLVALLALAGGLQETLRGTGNLDTAIVLRGGATAELASGLSREDATLILQAPGVARDAEGRAIGSAEIVVVTNIPKKSNGVEANVEIRGVGPQMWQVRPNVHIVEGRAFKPGLREVIVGRGARAQFAGLEPGTTINLNAQPWRVVGVFESGDAHESEIVGDAETVATTYRRNGFQSVTVRLASRQSFDTFKAALKSDPRLKVDVHTTRDYYTAQSEQLSRVIRIVGIVIATIMAIGAVFGALNTMYAAVTSRAREVATLRAIGFGATPVLVSVILEAMLLALLGGALGAAVTWFIFHDYAVSTLGSNFSQVVFRFDVSPSLVGTGLRWALAIGLVGGLLPAARAARLPVTAALRES
ncbi:MAG: Macrolide export ATP-binding/permease protein MacB [Steroidobacteraceae bacterium]|nr:Macrolide export ATP-binding/permease protein MacB [Steroidobacteraceae bacterium]